MRGKTVLLGGFIAGYSAVSGNLWIGKKDDEAAALCSGEQVNDYRPYKPPPSRAVLLAEYRSWLLKNGCEIEKLKMDFEKRNSNSNASVVATVSQIGGKEFQAGLLGTRSLKRIFKTDPVMARFPGRNAISIQSVLSKDVQGPMLKQLREEDIEQGYPIIIHLMIEKMKGENSYLKSWISMLPRKTGCPLTWTMDEIDWLRGTSLYHATMVKKKALEDKWKDLKHFCQEITKMENLHQSPTFQDFLWACTIFSSLSLPFPTTFPIKEDHYQDFSYVIIPGTELFKAKAKGPCRWDIQWKSKNDLNRDRKQKVQSDEEIVPNELTNPSLCAVCSRKYDLRAGHVMHVTPGADVSTEEILFQYGSLEIDPDAEVLMINCPLPDVNDWDEKLKAKFVLLQHRGLSPQIFLSRKHLQSIKHTLGTSGKFKARKKSSGRRAEALKQVMPPNVFETLEVFVLDQGDVAVALQRLIEGESNPPAVIDDQSEIATSGLRMAVLTTVTRLVEVKLDELESYTKGTGPLESDVKLLEAIEKEQQSITAMPHSGPTENQRAALCHRMEQKRLARDYLKFFNDELQKEMKYLHELKTQQDQLKVD